MKIYLLDSRGKGDLKYHKFIKADPTDDEIEIKTKYCGICRSDIAVYAGWEGAIPYGHFGHEGIGTVTKVGKNIKSVNEGDFVATTSNPAYGTFYNAKEKEFVKIPELSFKYILEPVACAINILEETIDRAYHNKFLMFGTGFMSLIIGEYCKHEHIDLTVVGNANRERWTEIGYNLKTYDDVKNEKFPVTIDLSSKETTFDLMSKITGVEGLIVMASTPFNPVITNFFTNSWNCHNFIFPSPRNSNFHWIMGNTINLIEKDIIQPKKLWTNSYSFHNAVQGFEDGKNRTSDYIRGFIEFDN